MPDPELRPLTADPGPAPLDVLIVEDEALVAMLIEDELLDLGHRPLGIADTVAAALAIADRSQPAVALCDVKLAGGDSGVDAAEALAARNIPCLFVSGNCPDAATSPLIVGCLEKPFRAGSLGAALAATMAITAGREPAAIPPGMRLYAPVA